MPQLSQCLRLYLPNALACHTETPANLFEGMGVAVLKSEAQPQNLAFAVGEVVKHLVQLLAQYLARGGLFGAGQILVLKEISQLAVFLFSDRGFK